MNLDQKQFTTSTMAAATGCEPMTFRTWRNRNGLFAEIAGGRNWKRFSVYDLCIVRTIVVMTRHGISAGDAIPFAQKHLRSSFEAVTSGRSLGRYIALNSDAYHPEHITNAVQECTFADDNNAPELREPRYQISFVSKDHLINEMFAVHGSIITIIDLKKIIDHVARRLDVDTTAK